MRYKAADINATLDAAQDLAGQDGLPRFVYATARGFGIYPDPPVFRQRFYVVRSETVDLIDGNY